MGRKRKLTAAEKLAKKERQKKYKWVMMNGKQVRVKREPTIDGIPVDQFIADNADALWYHQNKMWEMIEPDDREADENGSRFWASPTIKITDRCPA